MMTALESLVYHWGSAYYIWHNQDATKWFAADRRRVRTPSGWSKPQLKADTADELRQLIRADYRRAS